LNFSPPPPPPPPPPPVSLQLPAQRSAMLRAVWRQWICSECHNKPFKKNAKHMENRRSRSAVHQLEGTGREEVGTLYSHFIHTLLITQGETHHRLLPLSFKSREVSFYFLITLLIIIHIGTENAHFPRLWSVSPPPPHHEWSGGFYCGWM